MKEKISKEKINFLIDTLITSGGGHNQYGKLNDIIKTYTTENSLIRTTLLIWLDTMGILEIDNNYNYQFNKPVWIRSSISEHYILYGAITFAEKEKIESNVNIKKYSENKISYKDFEIELPDTYYTSDSNVFLDFDFKIEDTPLFCSIENMDGLSLIEKELQTGQLENLFFSREHETEEIDGYTLIINSNLESLTLFPQDDIKLFNWRTRNYIKCDITKELNLAPEEKGLKLIKVTKTYEGNHKKYFTILLEKDTGSNNWNYYYFDRNLIDERWARFLYIDKLEYYDIEKDFRGRKLEDKGYVYQNIRSAFLSGSDIICQNPDSNNFMKIPKVMKKQFVHYDNRQNYMAFPVTMPLPKKIMRYLYSCSGRVPQVFKNKFIINPDFNIKKLFSGVLTIDSHNVNYPDEKYFMEEDYYLFSSVPVQLAEKIFEKLNLDIKDEVFKRTFLQKI
jgi:hypothetical protein